MTHPAPQLPAVQISPVPQPAPSARLVHAVVLEPGWQLWHGLAGFAVPVG
jgi:hypothetical protein